MRPVRRDSVESDTFVMAGSEDLVPVRDAGGARIREDRDGFSVYPYRPRVEGGFARTERWVSQATGETHWQVRTPDNTFARYGSSVVGNIVEIGDGAQDDVYSGGAVVTARQRY